MNKRGPRTRYHSLERLVRGFSNHRRIEIMEFLKKCPEMSVSDIAKELKINYKTASAHINRLAVAGLVLKRYMANDVRHKLTDRALSILKFLRTLE